MFPAKNYTYSRAVREQSLASSFPLSLRFEHASMAAPPPLNAQPPNDPQGTFPQPWTFPLSQVKPTQVQGGTVKIVDQTTFPAANQMSAIEVTVEPGAMRFVFWSISTLL